MCPCRMSSVAERPPSSPAGASDRPSPRGVAAVEAAHAELLVEDEARPVARERLAVERDRDPRALCGKYCPPRAGPRPVRDGAVSLPRSCDCAARRSRRPEGDQQRDRKDIMSPPIDFRRTADHRVAQRAANGPALTSPLQPSLASRRRRPVRLWRRIRGYAPSLPSHPPHHCLDYSKTALRRHLQDCFATPSGRRAAERAESSRGLARAFRGWRGLALVRPPPRGYGGEHGETAVPPLAQGALNEATGRLGGRRLVLAVLRAFVKRRAVVGMIDDELGRPGALRRLGAPSSRLSVVDPPICDKKRRVRSRTSFPRLLRPWRARRSTATRRDRP